MQQEEEKASSTYSDKNSEVLKECIAYFKSRKGFKRIFKELRKKVKSYGRIGGRIRITINDCSDEELEAVGTFLGKIIHGNTISFTLADFDKALKESRYGSVQIIELLEGYFDESIISNKEERLKKEREKTGICADIRDRVLNNDADNKIYAGWLNSYTDNELFQKLGKSGCDSEAFVQMLTDLKKVCNHIHIGSNNEIKIKDNAYIRLAILADICTGNPHAYDRGTFEGQLLLELLLYINGLADSGLRLGGLNAEDIRQLYIEHGIMPDDISSFVVLYGISLLRGGVKHEAYEAFIENNESYMVSMSNISKVDAVMPVSRDVYIIENQMVFSHLCEICSNSSLVCTSGQMKTASLVLIDMLCKTDLNLYYCGDMDPEGLGIADRIVTRSGGRIRPVLMGVDDYRENAFGDEISEQRINKLNNITTPELIGTAELMKKYKKPAYQERTMNKLINMIRGI